MKEYTHEEIKEINNEIKEAIIAKTKDIEITKENIILISEFENDIIKICNKNDYNIYRIDDDKKTICSDNGGYTDPSTYTYEEYVNTLWTRECNLTGNIQTDNFEIIDAKDFAKIIIEKLNKLPLTYKMDCDKKIIEKILNDKVIPVWEERGIIGADKTFEENADHLNDILLDYVGDWWDETLKKITKQYMEMAKQKEQTREQMINTIIELCEKDLDIKERVAEWIIYETHPKYTDKYIYVDRIQNNDSDIKIEDILLYVITDGGNDLITMKKWWLYQIPENENEEYTTEQIKSLYNKIKQE